MPDTSTAAATSEFPALLKFRVREKTCHVKGADGVADDHDLVAVTAEQVDVLVDP